MVNNKLKEIASKIHALDNEVKLQILVKLIEEGAKSITDISKELKINFSTAHKYLEQLEKASLVTSKQVAENRLKRLFYVKDFNIDISPLGLSNLAAKEEKNKKSTFNLFSKKGVLVPYNEKIFLRKYINKGLPRKSAINALSTALESAYDGITVIELRNNFENALRERSENINSVLKQLKDEEIKRRSFVNVLSILHPDAIKEHEQGKIFIRQLDEPKLLNFIHDIRGIIFHGVDGTVPKNLDDIFKQIITAIKLTSKFTEPYHAFAAFNYVIAPFTKKLNDSLLKTKLKKFLTELQTLNINFYVNLDIGKSVFARTLGPGYFSQTTTYETLEDESQRISTILHEIVEKEKLSNIHLIFKVWPGKSIKNNNVGTIIDITKGDLDEAAYYVNGTRFGSEWRKLKSIVRIGELQDITINLTELALQSKKEGAFSQNLEKCINNTVNYITSIVESAVGEFLRNYNTRLKSDKTQQWNYISIDSCVYSISLDGLEDATKILSGKKDIKLAKKILRLAKRIIKNKSKMPIRIVLKENKSTSVADRFNTILKKQGYKRETIGLGFKNDNTLRDILKTA